MHNYESKLLILTVKPTHVIINGTPFGTDKTHGGEVLPICSTGALRALPYPGRSI
jgi:hypothetical protein